MRRAVILDKTGEDGSTRVFQVVFWFPVPTGRESLYASASATSALTGKGTLAPTTAEMNALKAGTVKEEMDNIPLNKRDANGDTMTQNAFLAAAQVQIQAIYNTRLAAVNLYNPHILLGTTYSDEAGWVLTTTP